MWFFNNIFFVNNLRHLSQENGFSPVWILMWFFNNIFFVNNLRHLSQQNLFSSVWIIVWRISDDCAVNVLVHLSQANVFFPVWINMWALRLRMLSNCLVQSEHLKIFAIFESQLNIQIVNTTILCSVKCVNTDVLSVFFVFFSPISCRLFCFINQVVEVVILIFNTV